MVKRNAKKEYAVEKGTYKLCMTEGRLYWWDYLIAALLAMVCFFCFQQRDLLHTTGCSVGYLNGHILDFYDYCGEHGIHPSYLPTVYILFAIWNIPMRMFGFLTLPTEDITLVATMWSKALPCAVYVASGFLVYKICMELGMGSKKAKYAVYAFLTMPIAFYNQFIFGQYDIFMTACMLLGVYYFLKKRDLWFVFWFGVAITFKYTALVLFLPLLLLREKNVWKIIAACIGVVLFTAFWFVLYRFSPGFSNYVFGIGSSGDNPTGYIFNAGFYTGFQLSAVTYEVSLVVLVYGVILGYAYFTRPADKKQLANWAFYLICLSFFVLFGLAKWHPQWLLAAIPFWVISAFLNRETKIFLIIDLIFMILFVMFNVQMIPNNVDQAMINKGVLQGLVDGNIGTKVMMKDLVGKLSPELCLSMISMIMLVYAIFKHPKYCLENPAEMTECMGWMRTRFLLGVASFVLPAFLCLYYSVTGAKPGYRVWNSFEETTAIQMTDLDSHVVQRFCATGESIDQIQFMVGVNNRMNQGYIKLTLVDCDENQILYEEDWATDSFVDGDIVNAYLNGIPTKTGGYYEVLLETTQAIGDYCLSVLGAPDNQTGDTQEYAYQYEGHIEGGTRGKVSANKSNVKKNQLDCQINMIVYQD